MSGKKEKQASSSSPTHAQSMFPFLLHDFITETSKTHPEVVRWSACGEFFFIDKSYKGLSDLIGKYFTHGKYESLRRQLNMYGFQKKGKLEKFADYYTRKGELFHRDRPNDLVKIKPRPMKSRLYKKKKLKKNNKDDNNNSSSNNSTTSLEKKKQSTGNTNSIRKEISSSPEEIKNDNTIMKTKKMSPESLSTSSSNNNNNNNNNKRNNVQQQQQQQSDFITNFGTFIDDCSISHPDIVWWNDDETAFHIDPYHPDMDNLLPNYFQHGNFQSFRRQLNAYGFRRDSHGLYRNPLCRKGDYSKLVRSQQKRRKKSTSRGSKALKKDDKKQIVSPPADDVEDDEATISSYSSGYTDYTADNSTLFDYDLSTYATLRTDEMSFERLDSRDIDEKSFERLDDGSDEEQESTPADQKKVQILANLPSTSEPTTQPKFKVLQRVYARDKDGVMYEAVVRRFLYGPNYHHQIQMGLVSSIEEADKMIAKDHDEEEPTWHYFVHYNKWNVSFDRWVSEYDVFEMNDEVKAYVDVVAKNHKALQAEMRKKSKGKKQWQTIDGAAFLKEWAKRLDRITKEMNFDRPSSGIVSSNDDDVVNEMDNLATGNQTKLETQSKESVWTKAALAMEMKCRQAGLTEKRPQRIANAIVLPFALKKILVEQWELINQCNMLPCLPSKVTVRQALDDYLKSKNVTPLSKNASKQPNEKSEQSHGTKEKEEHSNVQVSENKTSTSPKPTEGKEQVINQSETAKTNLKSAESTTDPKASANPKEGSGTNPEPMEIDNSSDQPVKINESKDDTRGKLSATKEDEKKPNQSVPNEEDDRVQEWRDMADGIAMLFDEALSTRLLYREELPQLRVIDHAPELSMIPYSELYGCEHLLRLFLRLPEILADQLDEGEARPIFAKVNDFVRFLHKNQGTLLPTRNRKLNDLEIKEQQKLLKSEKRKRKNVGGSATTSTGDTRQKKVRLSLH